MCPWKAAQGINAFICASGPPILHKGPLPSKKMYLKEAEEEAEASPHAALSPSPAEAPCPKPPQAAPNSTRAAYKSRDCDRCSVPRALGTPIMRKPAGRPLARPARRGHPVSERCRRRDCHTESGVATRPAKGSRGKERKKTANEIHQQWSVDWEGAFEL